MGKNLLRVREVVVFRQAGAQVAVSCWQADNCGSCPAQVDAVSAIQQLVDARCVSVEQQWVSCATDRSCPMDVLGWLSPEVYMAPWGAKIAFDRQSGKIACWGDASFGGDCDAEAALQWGPQTQIWTTDAAAVALDPSSGVLRCWGNPSYGGSCPDEEAKTWSPLTQIHAAANRFVVLDCDAGFVPNDAECQAAISTTISTTISSAAKSISTTISAAAKSISISGPQTQISTTVSAAAKIHLDQIHFD